MQKTGTLLDLPAAVLALLLTASGEEDPFELSWDRDVPVVSASVAFAAVWLAETQLRRPSLCPCSTAGIPSFDRVALTQSSAASATASDVLLVSMLILSPAEVTIGIAGHGARSLVEALVIQAESMTLSASLTAMVKDAVARPYPSVYTSRDTSLSGYESFWSGHAAATFDAIVTATYLLHESYPTQAWPWIAGGFGIAAATATSVLRVTAGVHFPSDVVVGALVGSGVGMVVPLVHRRRFPVQLTASAGGAALVGRF
jgi:membrane-associated phospholipid phosphatase